MQVLKAENKTNRISVVSLKDNVVAGSEQSMRCDLQMNAGIFTQMQDQPH